MKLLKYILYLLIILLILTIGIVVFFGNKQEQEFLNEMVDNYNKLVKESFYETNFNANVIKSGFEVTYNIEQSKKKIIVNYDKNILSISYDENEKIYIYNIIINIMKSYSIIKDYDLVNSTNTIYEFLYNDEKINGLNIRTENNKMIFQMDTTIDYSLYNRVGYQKSDFIPIKESNVMITDLGINIILLSYDWDNNNIICNFVGNIKNNKEIIIKLYNKKYELIEEYSYFVNEEISATNNTVITFFDANSAWESLEFYNLDIK